MHFSAVAFTKCVGGLAVSVNFLLPTTWTPPTNNRATCDTKGYKISRPDIFLTFIYALSLSALNDPPNQHQHLSGAEGDMAHLSGKRGPEVDVREEPARPQRVHPADVHPPALQPRGRSVVRGDPRGHAGEAVGGGRGGKGGGRREAERNREKRFFLVLHPLREDLSLSISVLYAVDLLCWCFLAFPTHVQKSSESSRPSLSVFPFAACLFAAAVWCVVHVMVMA